MAASARCAAVLLAFAAYGFAGCAGRGEEEEVSPGLEPPPTSATVAVTPAAVPDDFRALYQELERALSPIRTRYGAMPATVSPRLAGELLAANGNRGPELLQPGAMEGVRLYLDALQGLGAAAVNLSIVYPLFGEQEPRREEYLAFYREVVAECRRRGLVVAVEMGPAFAGTPYSTLHVDYTGLTPRAYLDARLRQAAIAAHALEPDYLTLVEEPDTERMLTGLDLTTEHYLEALRSARRVIDPPAGVLLGAGSGSWEGPDLVERVVRETDLDFVNIHVYPLSNGSVNYLDRAAEWATMARAAGKRAIIGETWLYKASVDELRTGLPYDQVYARDARSFWAPLDALHIETMVALARASGVEYVSFFWSKYLFAYLDAAADLSPLELMRQSNAAAVRAMVEHRWSASGEAFQRATVRE